MLRVELDRSLRRLRMWLLAALALAAGILPALVVSAAPGGGGGGGGGGGASVITDLVRSGLLDPIAAVFLLQTFFLPLATGLLAGDSIAGESSAGTLRYLLLRPVSRLNLVAAKYGAVLVLLAAGLLLLLVVGLTAGGIAFGLKELPTLSGTTLATGAALTRIVGIYGYVLAGLAGLAAVGVFVSALTESGPGATVATVAVAIVSELLDVVSRLDAIHPYLLTNQWMAWFDLLREPIYWNSIRQGLLVDACYVAIFLGAALMVFARRDVTS